LHLFSGSLEGENPHGAWMSEAFHRQIRAFSGGVRDMSTKYKILWFVVDMYHRQRYFFICGCKQTVTFPAVKTRWGAAEKSEFCSNFTSPLNVCSQIHIALPFPGWDMPFGGCYRHLPFIFGD